MSPRVGPVPCVVGWWWWSWWSSLWRRLRRRQGAQRWMRGGEDLGEGLDLLGGRGPRPPSGTVASHTSGSHALPLLLLLLMMMMMRLLLLPLLPPVSASMLLHYCLLSWRLGPAAGEKPGFSARASKV